MGEEKKNNGENENNINNKEDSNGKEIVDDENKKNNKIKIKKICKNKKLIIYLFDTFFKCANIDYFQ